MYLFFDVETIGLPLSWYAPANDVDNWPRVVQIAWLLCDEDINHPGHEASYIIKPQGAFTIPDRAIQVHGITTEQAELEGIPCSKALNIFNEVLSKASILIAHNLQFDRSVLEAEFIRTEGKSPDSLRSKPQICTKLSSTEFCQLPSYRDDGSHKWPRLEELYNKLFHVWPEDAHNALADVHTCAKCFFELKRLGVV